MNKANHEADHAPEPRREAPRLRHPDGAKAQAEADERATEARAKLARHEAERRTETIEALNAAAHALQGATRRNKGPRAKAEQILREAELDFPTHYFTSALTEAKFEEGLAMQDEEQAAAAAKFAEEHPSEQTRANVTHYKQRAEEEHRRAREHTARAAALLPIEKAKARLKEALTSKRNRGTNYNPVTQRAIAKLAKVYRGVNGLEFLAIIDGCEELYDGQTPATRAKLTADEIRCLADERAEGTLNEGNIAKRRKKAKEQASRYPQPH